MKSSPWNTPTRRVHNCEIHFSVQVMEFVNLYDAQIGEECFIGPFVEIGGAVIGKRTKISSHCYICPHVEIGEDCFIAHGVTFTNDRFDTPESYGHIKELAEKWTVRPTRIGHRVRIGSGSVILPVRIGNDVVIGAGTVVTKDVPDGAKIMGNPGRIF